MLCQYGLVHTMAIKVRFSISGGGGYGGAGGVTTDGGSTTGR